MFIVSTYEEMTDPIKFTVKIDEGFTNSDIVPRVDGDNIVDFMIIRSVREGGEPRYGQTE